MKPFHILIATGAAVAVTLFFSCNKDKVPTANDHDGPVISIEKPTEGQTFALGDTIRMLAGIDDDSELQDITVHLISGTDTMLLWPASPVILGNVKTYTIDDYVIDNINLNIDAKVEFYAVDKHDNATTTDINVHLTL